MIEVDKENQQNNTDTNGGGNGERGLGGGGGGMLGHMLQNGGRPHTPNSMPLPPTAPSNAWHNCRKMIYVPRPAQRGSPSGFWPIPESFWPDINTLALVRMLWLRFVFFFFLFLFFKVYFSLVMLTSLLLVFG